jgi:hypothetical protein
MKSTRFASCLVLLVLIWALPANSHALSVGSPYKMGSLLVFPLVDGSAGTDTEITITNASSTGVNVACMFRNAWDDLGGTVFPMRPRETVWFSTQAGEGSAAAAPFSPGEKGEMKCWAVSPSLDAQISWNYLQGFAQITDSQGRSWGYSSWNFAADRPRGASVGEPGVIVLSGLPGEYDAMPKVLSFNIPTGVTQTKVTLVLGKQDFRQDNLDVYSKAKFTYSRYGTSSTQCIKNWGQAILPKLAVGSGKVQGIASTVCDTQYWKPFGTTQNSPLLGVLEVRKKQTVFGIMPVGSGADGSGYVLWDSDCLGQQTSWR